MILVEEAGAGKNILYSRVVLGIIGVESCGPISCPTLSRAFTSENFTYEKTNLGRDWSPEARKKSEKILFSLKMRMLMSPFLNVSACDVKSIENALNLCSACLYFLAP